MDEKCRIKHLPSQQYLAVIPGEEGQQSLVSGLLKVSVATNLLFRLP